MRRYEKGDWLCMVIILVGIIILAIVYNNIDVNKRKKIEILSQRISKLEYSGVLFYISFGSIVFISVIVMIITKNKYIMSAVFTFLMGCLVILFNETIEKERREAAEKNRKPEKGNYKTYRIKGKAAASKKNHSKRNKR